MKLLNPKAMLDKKQFRWDIKALFGKPFPFNIHRLDKCYMYIIWALARAPDLHLNIRQLVTSSNNSTQKFHTFPPNFQPGHLNKDTWNVTVPDSLSLSLSLSLDSLSPTEKRQNVTFLIGYNSSTV